MPSVSKKQARFMGAAAHNPAFAKKVGIPVSVAKEFNQADKGKKFKKGGIMATESKKEMREEMKMDKAQDKAMIKKAFKMHDSQEHKGSKGTNLSKLKKGGVARTVTKEMEYDYKTGKKSFRGDTAQRDAHAEKEGKIVAKHAKYDKEMGMCYGGKVKKMAAGGKVMPSTMARDVEAGSNVKRKFGESAVQKTGHTKGKNIGITGKTVGIQSGAKTFARGGGIEIKGKTKGTMIKMKGC